MVVSSCQAWPTFRMHMTLRLPLCPFPICVGRRWSLFWACSLLHAMSGKFRNILMVGEVAFEENTASTVENLWVVESFTPWLFLLVLKDDEREREGNHNTCAFTYRIWCMWSWNSESLQWQAAVCRLGNQGCQRYHPIRAWRDTEVQRPSESS